MTGVSCPRTFQCSGGLVTFDIGPIPSYVAIASSSLSCLGSLLILVAYCVLRDMRTGAQKIITLLAVADLFSALGYIAGSINFLVHFDKRDDEECRVFQDLCDSQAIITSWSSLCSFAWTFILAFHFVMVIVFKRVLLASKLIPVYNIIAWGGPLLIVVPLAVLGKLGYAPYAASNWCFVKDNDYSSNLKQDSETILVILLAGKLWEIITYVSVTIFYIGIAVHISRSQRKLQDSTRPPKSSIEKRLLAIPLLFILLRMWGTVQFIYSLAVSDQNNAGCIPSTVRSTFIVIGILQAIGDGGQGWGNAILYVFLSPTIRHKLFGEPCDKCLAETENRIAMFLESDTETNASEKSETKNENGNGAPKSKNRKGAAKDGNEAPCTGTTKSMGYKIKRYTSTTEASAAFPSSDHESVQDTTNTVV